MSDVVGRVSLMSALDFCVTAAGSRLLRSNVLEPMTQVAVIETRLDAVQELRQRPLELLEPIKVGPYSSLNKLPSS